MTGIMDLVARSFKKESILPEMAEQVVERSYHSMNGDMSAAGGGRSHHGSQHSSLHGSVNQDMVSQQVLPAHLACFAVPDLRVTACCGV